MGVISNVGITIKFSPNNFLKGLKKGSSIVRKINEATVKDLSNQIRVRVREGVETDSLRLRDLSQDTIVTRRKGKLPGTTPARPRKHGEKPLFYTGQTVKNITVRFKTPVLAEVGGNPNARSSYSTGKSFAETSAFQERGFTRRFTFTKRMLAYLHILFRNNSGRGQRAREDASRRNRKGQPARVGVTYSKKVLPRPAYARAVIAVRRNVKPTFRKYFLKYFKEAGVNVK